MKKWISLLLALMLSIGAVFFSGAALAEDTTVSFSADSIYLAVGDTAKASVTVRPYVANRKGVTFQVSDEGIATVTSKGIVTAVAVGQCQLTAASVYDPSVSVSIPVNVIVPVSDVRLTADSDTLFVGETLQLAAACEPADASEPTVTYSTSDDTVATVTPDGLVNGASRGKATITAVSADGYAKASFSLQVFQSPESIDITPETVAAPAGGKVQLKVSVLPSDASDKSVTWSSGDEGIATVSAKGVATVVSVGETQITATSNLNPAISASVPVTGMALAQSIAFDNAVYSVNINETAQLYTQVQPEATTDKSVTYQVKNKKIATVDENGVVTGLKGGKTVVYAYTADGSKKRAAATIEVLVPVTGVSYKYKDVRVGAGNHGSYTVEVKPASATNKAMTWVSSDEGVASVTGTNNRFTVKGRRWGRCKVTGTTEDGGFTVDVYVDVGSLRHAVTISDVTIKNGKPSLVLKNRSDMNISQIRFQMLGYDQSLQPIIMSQKGDGYVLEGSYNVPLAEGETTRHGSFTFYKPSNYAGLSVLQFTITGWSTDSGFYDHNGKLQYNYNISEDKWEWVTYPSGVNPLAK